MFDTGGQADLIDAYCAKVADAHVHVGSTVVTYKIALKMPPRPQLRHQGSQMGSARVRRASTPLCGPPHPYRVC